MSVDPIDEAVRRGVPFRLKVTDAEEYRDLTQIIFFYPQVFSKAELPNGAYR